VYVDLFVNINCKMSKAWVLSSIVCALIYSFVLLLFI